jgi:hypothetical protein
MTNIFVRGLTCGSFWLQPGVQRRARQAIAEKFRSGKDSSAPEKLRIGWKVEGHASVRRSAGAHNANRHGNRAADRVKQKDSALRPLKRES